jgi:hypothetical protein
MTTAAAAYGRRHGKIIPLHSSNKGTNNNQQDDDNISKQRNEWQGFNPFDPTSQNNLSTTVSSSLYSSSSANRISMRKTRMQELMSNLLGVAGNEQAMQVLLESSKELLLEPLEDDDAVLETDSIYTPNMTRKERYDVYRTTMLDRIAKAKNTNVRIVLQKMSDFVLSHE